MRTAILSDIHGNLEALEAVLTDLETRMADSVVGLGDLIGYGPDPEAVVEIFRCKDFFCVLGNHEAALDNPRMRNWLNFQARDNSIMTEKLLSGASREYCSSLPENLTRDSLFFVHGFPPASVLRYATLVSPKELESYFSATYHSLCFVGHTHELTLLSWNGDTITESRLTGGIHQLHHHCKYIISAGSVGQPRDGSNSAKYLLWDDEKHQIEVVHVDYDIAKTVEKIHARGFPEAYGLRLW